MSPRVSEGTFAAVLKELREERVVYDRHQGRVRAFPHKEGSYATHVYIAGALIPCTICVHFTEHFASQSDICRQEGMSQDGNLRKFSQPCWSGSASAGGM